MKKALALVLALVLALSMAVSAFAVTLDEVVLGTPYVPGEDLITFNPIDLATDKVVIAGQGGTYHLLLDLDKVYDKVEVTATGAVTAKLVEYDPDTMEAITGVTYSVVKNEGGKVSTIADPNCNNVNWDAANTACKFYNDTYKTTQYQVVCDVDVNIIELTVEDNYTAAYKEGSIKINAVDVTNPAAPVAVTATIKLVRDVTIFKYEEVKWAAATAGASVKEGTVGYSDYLTALYGYENADLSASNQAGAVVVSTTAFRAIEGKSLVVVNDTEELAVTVKSVAAGQKGVNFTSDTPKYDSYTNKITFGYLGDQVINGEYTVSIDLDYTWFTLRETFGVKVEEDDIVTYYLLKDGKVVKEYVVDYMTVNYNEKVDLGDLTFTNGTLGNYELVLEVPAVEGGEENPNTGAESVVGVVAALAVVSVATAAAVSLKK